MPASTWTKSEVSAEDEVWTEDMAMTLERLNATRTRADNR
jgi:hypothetical protein